MVTNVAIDTMVGAIPFLGDVFDVAWKANRKNFTLLQEATRDVAYRQRRDWLFLAGVALVACALLAIPIMVIWALVCALQR